MPASHFTSSCTIGGCIVFSPSLPPHLTDFLKQFLFYNGISKYVLCFNLCLLCSVVWANRTLSHTLERRVCTTWRKSENGPCSPDLIPMTRRTPPSCSFWRWDSPRFLKSQHVASGLAAGSCWCIGRWPPAERWRLLSISAWSSCRRSSTFPQMRSWKSPGGSACCDWGTAASQSSAITKTFRRWRGRSQRRCSRSDCHHSGRIQGKQNQNWLGPDKDVSGFLWLSMFPGIRETVERRRDDWH